MLSLGGPTLKKNVLTGKKLKKGEKKLIAVKNIKNEDFDLQFRCAGQNIQQMVALHAVCWSKSSFSVFKQVFPFFTSQTKKKKKFIPLIAFIKSVNYMRPDLKLTLLLR